MARYELSDWLNRAALARIEDGTGPTITYPGLRISASVRPSPRPTLVVTVSAWDMGHVGIAATPRVPVVWVPVELFRDDQLLHRHEPQAAADVPDTFGARPAPGPHANPRANAARLDYAGGDGPEWVSRVNHAALAYNFDDAGPAIEYPGLRIFVCLQPGSALAINVWTKDTDEDSSLATDDDLPADIPVELSCDGVLVHCDAPAPLAGQV